MKEKNMYIEGSSILVVRKTKVKKEGNRNDKGLLSPEKREQLNCKELRDMRNQYAKKTYRSISLKYNAQKEADIIEHLDSQENLKEYLMKLLDAEMSKCGMTNKMKKEVEKSNSAKENLNGVQTTKTINQFLHAKKCSGDCSFKKKDLQNELPQLSESAITNRLQILCKQQIIEKHPKGIYTFYTVIVDPLEKN